MSISISVDTELHAAYIRLSSESVARTVEFSERIMIDLDEHGVAVGIELLDETEPLPFTELTEKFHVHTQVIDLLRLIRPDVSSYLHFTKGHDGVAQTYGRVTGIRGLQFTA